MKLKDMTVATLVEQTRKADANPGGGAVIILTANLANNLMLMMDKKDWGELSDQAIVSRETILNISEHNINLMQDDVEYFKALMYAYKSDSVEESHYINAAKPLLTMVENNIKSMEVLSFYLENGKASTLSDGEIANELLRKTIHIGIPTIRLNLDNCSEDIAYNKFLDKAEELYEKNINIIERRNK